MAHFRFVAASDGRVVWHFVTTNRRLLALSASWFESITGAAQAVAGVQGELDRMELVVVPDGPSRWGWLLVGGSGPAARSARSYQRRVECLRSVERFRSAAVVASADSELFDGHRTRRHER